MLLSEGKDRNCLRAPSAVSLQAKSMHVQVQMQIHSREIYAGFSFSFFFRVISRVDVCVCVRLYVAFTRVERVRDDGSVWRARW